jgi:periplasmic protein CpxP/Spy
MEKTKLLGIAVVALLLLNLGTLALLWFGRPPHPPKNGDRPPAAAFLVRELGLDAAQQVAYDRLRNEHRRERDSLQTILRDRRQLYFKGVATGDTTGIEAVAALERQMNRSTFEHFRRLRALCPPDQQIRLDQTLGEALRLMAQGGPPPR